MNEQRGTKLKLKRISFHPITTFILLSIATMIISWILSLFQVQATYNTIKVTNLQIDTVLVTVNNMLNYDGIKFLIGKALSNFAGLSSLSILLISLIGLSVAHATGLINAFIKRVTINLDNKKITFFLILIAILSSWINEVGYAILIPLGALVYLANGRNPLLGITTAFCGVAFGYGTTFFAGAAEIELVGITTLAARLIDSSYHVSLTSNVIIMLVTSIILAIVGTIVIEKVVVRKIGKYKLSEDDELTKEIKILNIDDVAEQSRFELENNEKKGLRNAYIIGIIVIMLFIYMIIPNLPLSGLLLNMNETTYVRQLLGNESYFQEGFTLLVSVLFILTGIAYGIGAKTIKNDKDLIEKSTNYFKDIGGLIITMFFASQFIALFNETNIGTIILAWGANIIKTTSFSGIPLIILCMLVIAVCGIFVPSMTTKWSILSPVIVPLMMQSNISPQFAQFVFRASDSISKGLTPILSFFVIYIGYLNIYNKNKEPISIKRAISYVMPYCLIIGLTWILIIIGWYILGLPIGPGVYPII